MNADRFDDEPVVEPETVLETADRAAWEATQRLNDLRALIPQLQTVDEALNVYTLLSQLWHDASQLTGLALERADAVCGQRRSDLKTAPISIVPPTEEDEPLSLENC